MCVCEQSQMGIKALGWGTTICHPCSSYSVTESRVQVSANALVTGLCPCSKGWLQTGQVQTSVWASSQERGMSVEGNHSESERAREG